MADADKCHLNIPWKETARTDLELDREGKLDPQKLKNFQAREFDNYKAIERRINDPACTPPTGVLDAMFLLGTGSQTAAGGAATNYIFFGSGSGAFSRVKRVGAGFDWGYTSSTGTVNLPSGLYQITGGGFWAGTTVAGIYLMRCRNDVSFGVASTQTEMRDLLLYDQVMNDGTNWGLYGGQPTLFSGPLMSTADFSVGITFQTNTGVDSQMLGCHLFITRLGDFYADA